MYKECSRTRDLALVFFEDVTNKLNALLLQYKRICKTFQGMAPTNIFNDNIRLVANDICFCNISVSNVREKVLASGITMRLHCSLARLNSHTVVVQMPTRSDNSLAFCI